LLVVVALLLMMAVFTSSALAKTAVANLPITVTVPYKGINLSGSYLRCVIYYSSYNTGHWVVDAAYFTPMTSGGQELSGDLWIRPASSTITIDQRTGTTWSVVRATYPGRTTTGDVLGLKWTPPQTPTVKKSTSGGAGTRVWVHLPIKYAAVSFQAYYEGSVYLPTS
jgi:hypothetical protein